MHAAREGSENANGSRASRRPTEMPCSSGKENARPWRVEVGIEKDGKADAGREARLAARMRLCLKLRQGASPLRPRPLSLEMNGTEGRKFVKGSLRRSNSPPLTNFLPSENAPDDEGKGASEITRFRGHRSGFEELNAGSVLDRYRPSHGSTPRRRAQRRSDLAYSVRNL
jgi:hypothetical protein